MNNKTLVSLLSWNIHGNADALEGPKNKNTEVLKYLERHQIFCLQETKCHFSIPNYRCFNSNRKNSKSGGVCIGIHRSLEKHITHLETESEDIQAIKICGLLRNPDKDLVIINVYDSPPTSSYKQTRSYVDSTLDQLIAFITTLPDAEVLVTGDFNARCADKNYEATDEINNWVNSRGVSKLSYHEVSNRISEDKVLNSRGKNLLDVIGSIGLTILNGSVLGDIAGKYTCHLYNGSSTVDYILTSQNLKSKVESMIVGELTRFSDHCNLSMKLDIALPISSILSASKYSKAPKRYPWNKESSRIRFTSELNSTDTKDVLVGIFKTNCQNTRDVDDMKRKTIEVYQNAAEKSITGKKHKNNIPQIANQKNPGLMMIYAI